MAQIAMVCKIMNGLVYVSFHSYSSKTKKKRTCVSANIHETIG